MIRAATLPRMAKRKSGEHKTPRRPIQFPMDWFEVAQQLAAKRPTPTVWYLVQLVKADAEAQGIKKLPKTPWEKEAPSAD
jgi:hypothetical protein